ncbi:Histone-lysine N-methyltransferase setd3 [Quaeritorhiza haematococci]|nr:Histone-lysine N-methyltransferase setd3 [Quaeritorhiza haematococci]
MLDLKEYGAQGNGVFAIDDIEVEELIAKVPRKLMLTMVTALKSPVDFGIPLFYTSEEMQQLKGSHVLADAITDLKSIVRNYVHIYRVIESMPEKIIPQGHFTFVAFRWAIAIVMTRQNQIPMTTNNDGKPEMGMVTTYFDVETKTSETYSPAAFQKGEQVLITYGNRSNQDLLLYSGFVDTSTLRWDKIKVFAGLSKTDSLMKKKQAVLEKCGMPPSGMYELRSPPVKESSTALMLFLRIFWMSEEQIDVALSAESLEYLREPVDPVNEGKALQWIKTRCTIVLKAYPTSKDQNISDATASRNMM